MTSPKTIAIFIAILASLWMASGIMAPSDAKDAGTEQEAAKETLQKVRVRNISAAPYQNEINVTGRTQASKSVDIKAEISGEIVELLKEEGDSVSPSDVLAKLDLREKREREAEAKGRLQQRRIEYNAAKKLENKGFNSRVRLSQALADLESAKAALKQAEIDVQKSTIIAPFTGIIARQNIEVGDYVSAGDTLFSLVNLNPIEIVVFLSERKVQELELGQSAAIEFLDGETVSGEISYIAPAADEQSRTFRVIMTASNENLKIRDGLTSKVKIPVAAKQAHRISPSILTLNTAGQIGVKIVNGDDVVEFVAVTILADQSDAMWITGPAPSVRMITVGQEFVIEGQKVEPLKAQGEGLL